MERNWGFEMDRDFMAFGLMRNVEAKQYPGIQQCPSVPVTKSLTSKMACAHYSDDRFKREQVVYDGTASLDEFKKLSWDYSDRFSMWDYDKSEAARKYAIEKGDNRQVARFWKRYLDYFYDGKVELKAVATGFNLWNGYEYYVLGYLQKESDASQPESTPENG